MAETLEDGIEVPTGWHRVCLNTIVRKGVELDSERLRILPMGSRVFVKDVRGRRVRITSPIDGWCSKKSSTMDTILEKIVTTDGGVTPSNRNQHAKLKTLMDQIDDDMPGEQQEAIRKEITDLKNVIKNHENARKELEEELSAMKSKTEENERKMAETSVYRAGDVVQFTGGLGIVKFVGYCKGFEEKFLESVAIGIAVEPGFGDHSGLIELLDGSMGGWQAGENGAMFLTAEEVSWLPGERMLDKLQTLTQEKQLFESALKIHFDEEQLAGFWESLNLQ